MAVGPEEVSAVIEAIPADVLTRLDFIVLLVQALGGLFVVYLIILIIQIFFEARKMHYLRKINNDMELLKKKLKIKDKKD
jgi:beta-lactamase regulating signal transducer with metallopeptidase domain